MKLKNLLIIALFFPMLSFAGAGISIVQNPSCGQANGQLSAYFTGGFAPYTYQWNTGATTSTISGLLPGNYSVSITDAMGTTGSASVLLTSANTIQGATLSFNPTIFGPIYGFPCPHQCNGIVYLNLTNSNAIQPISITSSAGGGNANYFDQSTGYWVVSGVCASDQVTVTFTDASGCQGTATSSNIPVPNPNYLDSMKVYPSCQNQGVGKIGLYSLMGSWAYNVITCTGPTNPNPIGQNNNYEEFNNLLPGIYTIKISQTGADICDSTFTVVVPSLGTNCGFMEGDVVLDSISNCLVDTNEQYVANQIVEVTPGNYYATTNPSGHFMVNLPYGTYQVRSVGNAELEPVCTQSGLVLSASNDTITNIVLGDTIKVHIDASVSVTMGAIRPGFNHDDYIYVSNNSWSDSLNPVINVVYDPQLTLINCPLPYSVISSHEIQIQLPIIAAHENYSLVLTYSVPANPNLIGTSIGTSVSLSAVANDEISANNSDSDIRVVTGSFDPNEILVSPRNDPYNYFFMDVDTALSYTIYFQNTGTDTAFNIVVVDSLDQHLIPSTFEMLGSSHPCHYDLSGQHTLKFYFDNILLPDSNVNEPMSHGYVKYKIKPELYPPINPYLISNRADIYFDFNPAIQTNTVVSTMDVSVGLNELSDVQFKVQPNPVENKLQIVSSNDIKINSILVTDLTGRVVLSEMKNATAVDVSNLASGMYCARIQYFATNSSNMHTSVVTFAKK
jgi:uncharacterized repeat protein (TIGR01451 family)